MNDSESFRIAKSAALNFLSYRARSEAEVRSRLSRRFSPNVVEQVIEELAQQDLLNDSNFARVWTENRDTFKPRSAAAIKQELLSKGVARDVAQSAVEGVDDTDGAYRAAQRRAERLRDDDLPTCRRKLMGFLQRRGFSRSVSRETISRLWSELPDDVRLSTESIDDG